MRKRASEWTKGQLLQQREGARWILGLTRWSRAGRNHRFEFIGIVISGSSPAHESPFALREGTDDSVTCFLITALAQEPRHFLHCSHQAFLVERLGEVRCKATRQCPCDVCLVDTSADGDRRQLSAGPDPVEPAGKLAQ